MASDIKLNDNAVVVEGGELHSSGPGAGFSFADRTRGDAQRWVLYAHDGKALLWSQASGDRVSVHPNGNVGINTNAPQRTLHVEGGEIHSGGGASGFSFSDRSKPAFQNVPQNGERWVWYAQDGKARLWSGKDVLTVNKNQDNSWATQIEGKVFVDNDLFVNSTIRGTARVEVESLLGREMGPKRFMGILLEANALQLASNASESNPRFALVHDLHGKEGRDALVINHEGAYKQGVRIESNVQVTGTLTQASSIALKENVAALSGPEAMAALQGLNAVKYTYKADANKEQRIGFIAEDVPDLVAAPDRDRLSPMDLIAVLTKAVQELAAEVRVLKEQIA